MTNQKRGPNIDWAQITPTIQQGASLGHSKREIAHDCAISYASLCRLIEQPHQSTGARNNTSDKARAARIAYFQGRAMYFTNLALRETAPR